MIVYQSRTFLLFAIATCALGGLAGVIATMGAIRDSAYFWAALFVAFAGVSALAANDYIARFRKSKPLVTLSPLGVTNEHGESFNWSQISKIYKWTGALFVRDDSRRAWVVRVDPAEVGRDQLTRAIEFIKSHAPAHLIEHL